MVVKWRRILAVASLFIGVAAHASPPAGRYVVNTDVVTDTVTGLTWQRGKGPAWAYTLSTAQGYCSSLVLGGLSGWRLPTIKELQSLMDVRTSAIDTTAFLNDGNELFWSSTSYAPVCTSGCWVWALWLRDGTIIGAGATDNNMVRCVR